MEQFTQEFFNLDVMAKVAPFLLQGLLQTLLLCSFLIPIGLVSGILVMLLTTSPYRLLRWPAIAAVDFFRAFRRWCCWSSSMRACPLSGCACPRWWLWPSPS
jgi:polar amino acid transport system permease protein